MRVVTDSYVQPIYDWGMPAITDYITRAVRTAPKLVTKTVKTISDAPKTIKDSASNNISKLNKLSKRLDIGDQYLKGWTGTQNHGPSSPSSPPKRKPIDSRVDAKWEFLPADQALSYGLSRSSQAARNGVKDALEIDKIEKAQKQAAELEKLKRQKFEQKLQAQNPQRYQAYKKTQEKTQLSILADADPETHRRREFRHQEALREREMLIKDPSAWRRNLAPESCEKLSQREDNDLRKLESSSAPTAPDLSALRGRLAQDEKRVFPNKSGWLKSLPPEQRQRFLQRQAADEASILSSGMKANQAKEVVKDVVTLGANSAQKKEGLTGAAKELLTLGIYGLAKSGGEDLGKGQALLDQAKNAERSGSHIDALTFQEEGEKIQNQGLIATGMAFVGANSARPLLKNGINEARFQLAKGTGTKRQVETGGLRGEKALTDAQKAEMTAYAKGLGMPEDQIKFWSANTSYADSFDALFVGTDVMPAAKPSGLGTATANQRLGWKAALSHEIVGHRASALAGKAHSPGSALDEAQASIRAARFGEDMTRLERIQLLRDGINRLHNEGLKIRDVRQKLWITEK